MGIDRFALPLGFALLLAASPALADENEDTCTTDADCGGYGLRCVAWTYEDCPDDDGACADVTVHLCGPGTCTSDADCTGGTSCVTFGDTDCDYPCDPDDPDCTDDETDCETTSESYCVPPYFAPCTTDASCGPGFSCEEEMECWSEGDSSGTTEEHCEPTGESECELVPADCTTDADCAAGLTCIQRTDYDEDEEGNEFEITASFCVPPSLVAWEAALGGGAKGGADDGDSGGGRSLGESSDGSGGGAGCAAAGTSTASILGLLAVALFLRRR